MADLRIAQPLTLKCGLTLPNRLVKASLAESMADPQYLPGQQFHSTYGEWADGGYGMILTGNVQIDPRYLGTPKDPAVNGAVEREKLLASWKSWAAVCSRSGTPTVVQINHPGRQSPRGAGTRGIFEQTVAPSAVPLRFGDDLIARVVSAVGFGTPKEMTTAEIQHVVDGFVETSRLAAEAGFAGMEVHAAHGYLLTQFLSAKTNQRTDAYGGSPAARAKIVVDIIHAIRAAVPEKFCVGIKLNSVDHQSPEELAICIEQLKLIEAAGVDFLEVSGGTYEDPTMNTGVIAHEENATKSDRTKARESFFLEFAKTIRRDFPDLPLMVTGGFRSRVAMETAVSENGCDLIGLGRPTVVDPAFPKHVILNPEVEDADAVISLQKPEPPWILKKLGVKALFAGNDTTFYAAQIQKMGQT